MSADITNLSLIQDEDVLRKMWQDTEDFGKKKEIRSHMYKLREQRLKEFYNSGEITETKMTKTTGKVTQSSTHADSLVDQSFNSLKSKEVRDSESPTRDMQYKVSDNKEWQIGSNNEISKDGKTKVYQSVAAVQGSQKIDGGQVDFKARSEQSSSVYEDANTKAISNKYQTSESASSRVVSSKNIPVEKIELPSNLQDVTKVSRETKTLPDGSVVTTTRYDTESGASQTCVEKAHVKASQTSVSSRSVNQSQSSSELTQNEIPSKLQGVTKITRESKTLPDGSVISTTRYHTVGDSNESTTQTGQIKTAKTSFNRKEKDSFYSSADLPSNLQEVTKVTRETKTSADLPSNLQGVTKVIRETKTLPDGSTVTTTRYDTSGATSHSETTSNVKFSKDHTSTKRCSEKHNEQKVISEYGSNINNQQNYRQQNIDFNIIDNKAITEQKDHFTENKKTSESTDEKKIHKVDEMTSKITKELYGQENIKTVCLDETDGNKISYTVTGSKQPADYVNQDSIKHVKNITTQQQNATEKLHTDNFVEHQQEQIIRDKNTTSLPTDRPTSTKPRGRSPTKAPKSEYEPSKPTEGQYATTYKTDYTNRKISVEVSPTHDAFARSLRSVSPDRIPNRGSHRSSNSSLPEKMRHPSRYSPERQSKDESISPTKSDRFSSTDTYIHYKNHNDERRSPSPKRNTSTTSSKKTSSNETSTISSSSKFDIHNKKQVTKKSNSDVVTKSRSPSPTKTRNQVTDLDDDLTIITTIREKTQTGERPTSLELSKKTKKVTDRSPSSPLNEASSPKKSPTKEIKRSSSFKSPTKDSSSPKGFPSQGKTPQNNLKSPTKENPSSKHLPENRPLKRTDTYEERCRQILGITEVTDKRRSSLERSSSKRNSLRRNISSTDVDTTVKSPTKDSSILLDSIMKNEREKIISSITNHVDVNETTLLDETKTIINKESTRKGPSSRPSSRPTSKDFSTDVTLETIITQKGVPDKKPTNKSSITEFPSQKKSPTREFKKPEDDRITAKRPSVTTYPDSPSRAKSPTKDVPKANKIDKVITTEFITQEKHSTTENILQTSGPIGDKPSTKRPKITEYPSQQIKTKTNKTVSVDDIDQILVNKTIDYTKDVTSDIKINKSSLITEFPSQIRHSKDKSQTTIDKNQTTTSKYISENKDTISSSEDITMERDIVTESNIKSKYKDEHPSKKPLSEFPSQSKIPTKDTTTDNITINENLLNIEKDDKPATKQGQQPVKDNKVTTNKFIAHEKMATDETISKSEDMRVKSQTIIAKTTKEETPKKSAPVVEKPSTKITDINDFSLKTKSLSKETKTNVEAENYKFLPSGKTPEKRGPEFPDTTNEYEILTVEKTTKSTTKDDNLTKKPLTEFPSQYKSPTKISSKENFTKNQNINKDVKITTSETEYISKPKKMYPSPIDEPSLIKKDRPVKDKTKVITNKFISQEKIATDKISSTEDITIKSDITQVSKTTKYSPKDKEPKKIVPIIHNKNKTATTTVSQEHVNIEKTDINDVTDIIEDLIITDKDDNNLFIKHKITEHPSQTRPTKEPTFDTTDFAGEVIVTDEFEINITKSKPYITEFPSQIRKNTEKKPITKTVLQGKINPKEKLNEKPKITEFPSQIKRDKKPTSKEPNFIAKHVQPISYEGKVPIEEPIFVKKHINSECPDDEHNKHHIVKKVIPTTTPKKLQKQYSVDKPDKKTDIPLSKKPLNGVTEYTQQYSKPKSAPGIKTKTYKPEELNKVPKPLNRLNTPPTKPSSKPLVNGIKKDKTQESTSVFLTSIKQPRQPVSEIVIKKSSKSSLLKENEISVPSPKSLKTTRIATVRGTTLPTKLKPSQPEEIAKKHVVTTNIILKNGHQPTSTQSKKHPTKVKKVTNFEKKITDSKQQEKFEVSTETDEESAIEEITENIGITKKNVSKITEKPDKKCVTTKTVIINNNSNQAREIIVDLQRSTSSREPTPDIVCPVPLSTENGEYELPRYPDEIVEPDDDSMRGKTKRLSDIPLIEYEDTTNFSRITEIVDSHVITERDKVDHTDESLLSVNRKINLFSDTADKLTKDTKKSSGPAPKVNRPKLNVSKDLESDECLLSVSEKVNKFVNTAEQFMNVHDTAERPKSPRCKFANDKVVSDKCITNEQISIEQQVTGRISLENLNIDTKKTTERKSSRTTSPESKPTHKSYTSQNKTGEETNKYPNYKTITKRISLDILDSEILTKSQDYNRPKSPDRKSPTRTNLISCTTKEIKGRDSSPISTPKNTSPEPKLPETPKRRPSNEYTNIKNIKTTDKLIQRDISPDIIDTTPKSGRSKPIEDKRTILSSTGRLRSTESIKRARALFENISKEQEPVKPSNKYTVSKRNNTNSVRKISYSSEEDKSPKAGRSRSNSPIKHRPVSCSPESGEIPHYMLPIDRSSLQKPHKDTTSSTHSVSSETPHYMLPLDRTSSPHKPHKETTSSTHSVNSETPHYMLPLDRTSSPHKPHRENTSSTHSVNSDTPHYMLPLDRNIAPQSYSTETTTLTHNISSNTPHYILPVEKRTSQGSHKETKTTKNHVDSDSPHYMLPLDRTLELHGHHKETTTSSHSINYDIPHYMLPLDRNTSPQGSQKETTTATHFVDSDTHHYMLPLDRSITPHGPQKETTTATHLVESDTHHYMLPLDRSITPHGPQKEKTTAAHFVEYDTHHYMLPLDRSISPHGSQKDTTAVTHFVDSDTHHYMLPLDRSITPHGPQKEKTTATHFVESDTHHYMLPLDRSISPHGSQKDTTTATHFVNSDTHHYMLPLDRSITPHGPQKEKTTAAHFVESDTHHYMLPLDRSISPHGSQKDLKTATHFVDSDTQHYMLPLDRSISPHSPQKETSTATHFVDSDSHHYMLPLDRSITPHGTQKQNTTATHFIDSNTHHYMLPLDRSITPQGFHKETIPPTQHTDSDSPHYMLPLDRSISPTSSHKETITAIHNVDSNTHHYMKPLDRSITPHSPHKESAVPIQHIDSDSPHYMLPLDRSVTSHHHNEDLTTTQNVDSRTTKFGVTLRKTPTLRSPNNETESTKKTFIERRFGNVETLREEEIQDIFEIEILEELLQKVTTYEIRRIIRTQIHLVKTLISENRLTIYIKEREQLKKTREYTQKSEHHSTQSWSKRRESSDSTTKEIRKQSPTRQSISPRTSSPIRKQSTDETTITSTTTVTKTSSPRETIKTTKEVRKISPERTTTTCKSSVERSSITETIHSPSRPLSPTRKLNPDEAIIRSTYTVRKSPVGKTPEVNTRKTEEIRKSSPERSNKTTMEQIRKTSTDITTYTTTERSTKTTTKESKISSERSPTRKTELRRPSPDRKSENKSAYSVLKKTDLTKKKVEDTKPEWVTQRNLKKVTPTTSDKTKTSSSSTTSKTVTKKEKIVSSSSCQPTDLITSSYGVGPTDENGTPLFGLKALRTQNNNNTTKVQGTFISSEYYSENGQEPVGQISITKYSTDPRDLSTDEQIENNKLVTSVTTTQRFGFDDTPSLETLTNKRVDKQIEDSVVGSDRSSTFKRKNSVKAISQKFIDSTVDSLKNERQTAYPKAGLILRTSSFKDSKNAASNEEDASSGTITSTKTTKQTTTVKSTGGGSFLSNKSTVSGVQDVITRMKTEDYQEGESTEDTEARNLLNKFIGSQVLLSGMENRDNSSCTTKTLKTTEVVPTGSASTRKTIKITKTVTEGGKTKTKTLVFQSPITVEELENIWDEQTLRLLLEQSTEYEERRNIRLRLKKIMAEQEACAELVEKASQEQTTGKIDETVTVEKSITDTPVTTKTQVTKVTTQQQVTKKPLSPFAKFRQLDKQNSLNTPPSTPGSPKTPGNGPLFKFTDPAVSQSASTIKERLLFWCKMKTKEYENVQLDNFSSSWADGLAFCALIHHFHPDAFDYHALTPKDRRHNFELAFRVASEKADIFPLLDVEDMMEVQRPDWKCVFTYVQSIFRRFKNEEI